MAKIAFLQNFWIEWLGVMCLSAILKKEGHDTDIFIGSNRKIMKELGIYTPNVIAISAMNMQYNWLEDILICLRKNNFTQPIIVGGPLPTFSPEKIIQLSGVDVICIGEGEGAIREFVDAVENKKTFTKIENLWIKKSEKKDSVGYFTDIIRNPLRALEVELDRLPYPDRELYRKYRFFRSDKLYEIFLAGRGCPFNCSFCFNHQLRELYIGKGKSFRIRSPQNVVDEIKYVVKNYGAKNLIFSDSTLNLDKKWIIDFCTIFSEHIRLPISCNIRADMMDDDIAKALSTVSCNPARFAIETGNEDLRNSVLCKKLTDQHIYHTVSLLKKYKIPFVTFSMMGLPTETLEMAWQTIYMNRRIRPIEVRINMFMPYPNLSITKYAQRHRLIDNDSLKNMSRGRNKIFGSVLKQKDIKEVSNLHKFSILLIRFPKLEKLAKKLIKLPENIIFDGIYLISAVSEFLRLKISIKRFIIEIFKNIRGIR